MGKKWKISGDIVRLWKAAKFWRKLLRVLLGKSEKFQSFFQIEGFLMQETFSNIAGNPEIFWTLKTLIFSFKPRPRFSNCNLHLHYPLDFEKNLDIMPFWLKNKICFQIFKWKKLLFLSKVRKVKKCEK